MKKGNTNTRPLTIVVGLLLLHTFYDRMIDLTVEQINGNKPPANAGGLCSINRLHYVLSDVLLIWMILRGSKSLWYHLRWGKVLIRLKVTVLSPM